MNVRSAAGLVAALGLLAGCAGSTRVVVAGRSEPSPAPAPTSPVAQGPVPALKIPPGHYPPPGECRIWMPGVPPGRQPAPSECMAVHGHVPLGAWVLYRPPTERKLVEVTAYDSSVPERVMWVRYYDSASGRFVHEVLAN